MALFNMQTAVEALDDLLDHERQMILAGRIDALLRLSADKERQMARLPAAVSDPQTLERLRAKLARNQELLAASARGIKAVRDRIAGLQAQQTRLNTYSRDGASTTLGRTAPGINKRS